jgi:DNA polymerase III subunit gamma/tau
MPRMASTVLARKYRSRSFAEMVGQEAVVTALTNALSQQRLHHAYLFTGTRGIGKTTVSRILAKCLNCTGPDDQGGITATPCGVCAACTEIDADRYIDYIELDAASNRGIDDIKELLERAAYKPSVGRFKIFMIDEAHQLTKDSFNALLKTLEEPPEYLKFVLATTDPEKMLPTVLSRCLQFNLRPMAPEVVAEHLRHVLAAEGVAFDETSLRLIARAARGSMRDGLSLTDQAIAYGGGALTAATVRAMLGSVDRGHAQGFVRALAARDGLAVLAGVDALREHGLSAAGTLEELAGLLQAMAIEQAVPGALAETEPDTPVTRELAALLPPDETQLLYSFALHGRQELTLAPDTYAGLAMVLLRLLAFSPAGGRGAPARAAPAPAASSRPTATPVAVSVAANAAPKAVAASSAPAATATTAALARALPSQARVASVARAEPAPRPLRAVSEVHEVHEVRESGPPSYLDDIPLDDELGAAPSPSRRPVVSAPTERAVPAVPPAAAFEPTPLGERWVGIVALLNERQAIAALVKELAMQAQLIEQQDGAQPLWRLRVERESLRSTALLDKLRGALAEALGIATLRLEVEAGPATDSPAKREAAERERRQRDAEATIHNDPLVREMLAQFPTARIVPGSIKFH